MIKRKIDDLTNSGNLIVCEPLAAALLDGVEKRFSNFFLCDELRFASAIHPRFKFNWVLDSFFEEIDGVKTVMMA